MESTNKRSFSVSIWREDDWYIAQCLDVDIASQGKTEGEALANISEALELHFEPPVATQLPTIRAVEIPDSSA